MASSFLTEKNPILRRLPAALFAVLLLNQVMLVRHWTRVESRPAPWDPAVHLGTAQDYREAARDGRWLDLLLTKPRPGHPPYPPFYGYTVAPIVSAAAPQTAVAWINVLYWAILVGAAGWLAFQLGGVWTSGAALLVLGLSPHIMALFREAFPDLALAAWVALAYALIFRSEGFRARLPSIAAGVCLALAALSKWSAPVYLLPGLATGLLDGERRRNLALACGVAALMCLPWYSLNIPATIPRVVTSMGLGPSQGQPATWTPANWTYYPGILADCYGAPGAILMAIGLGLGLWKLRRLRGSGLACPGALIGWLLFSYVAWSLVSNKNDRYILPALAAAPVIGLFALPRPVLALAALLTLVQARSVPRPSTERWPLGEILRTVEQQRDPSAPFATLCVLPNDAHLNATSLAWTARHERFSHIVMGGQQSEIPEWSDFVLSKTGNPGPYVCDRTLAIIARAQKGEGLFPRVFREIGRWPLPDGSEAVLYRQRDDLPMLAKPRTLAQLRVKSALLRDVRVLPLGGQRYDISVSSLEAEKLPAPVREVHLRLSGARLLEHKGVIYVTRLGGVELVSAKATWDDLSRALSARAKLPLRVESREGALRASLASSRFPLEASIAVEAGPDQLTIQGVSARAAGIPLPFFGSLAYRQSLSADPPYQPFKISLGRIAILGDRLAVGGLEGSGAAE